VQPETPTTGGLILEDVVRFIRRFVVLTETQANTLALWSAHTHAIDAADTTPYLAVTSPEKRSGKTRLLEVLELIEHDPLPTANTSDAALFRSVSKELPPTLLLDEVDAVFKAREREDLRGLLNAGFRRGAVVRRMGGAKNTTLETFRVFCPKAFAGIGNCLPDTILDRSITIALQRKTRDEVVERFRRRDVVPEGEELHDRLADWLEPQVDELHGARPALPDELDDRAQDMWEPLFAIAELAGGDWPQRALRAALELSGNGAREDDSLTALLLRDIYTVFSNGVSEHLKTADLIAHLAEIEESPWGDWYGKLISPQALSKLLKPHRIKTMPVWIDGKTARGYKAEQFAEAFHRVLGVRSVRDVRSESPSHAAPNAPNAPNASGAGKAPFPGDDDFLDYIAGVHATGHITTGEALEREGVHALVLRARERSAA
jgi:hypothetical protein